MTSHSVASRIGVRQCKNCQGARFNDAQSGGHEVKLASGRKGLHFTLDRFKKTVLDYGWTLEDSLPHLPKLSETAQAGCEFCQFLINLLRSQDVTCLFKDVLEDPDLSNETLLRLYCSYTWANADRVLIDENSYGIDKPGLRYFQLRAILETAKSKINAFRPGPYCIINCLAESPPNVTPEDECSAWLGLRTSPTPLGLSNNEALAKLRTTLSHCFGRIGNHELCGEPHDISFLPTRLLEIDNNTQVLRLVHSRDIKKQLLPNAFLPHYAALSYCWGEMQDASYQLTSLTEASKMNSFRVNLLPEVIRDAIALTRSLSLSYIWIDALCILQDMSADWEHESSQMVGIYGSAYVTICSLTPSAQLSFLEPERPKDDIQFQSSINSNISGSYRLSYLEADIDNAGRNPYMHSFPKSRWFSRGWTYQELRFSRRLLLLDPSYSAFMCAGLFNVLGGPEVEPAMILLQTLGNLTTDTQPMRARVYSIWLDFAERYSGRLLTYPQDALPAISGAAKLFGEKLSDKYLAGVWRSDLRGILWNYPSIPMTPPLDLDQVLAHLSSSDNYVAPSWSWVGHRYMTFAVRPAIQPPKLLLQCQIEVSTIIDGKNLFGRVKGGQLTITGPTIEIGPFIPISFGHLSNELLVALITQDGVDISLFLDWQVDTEHETLQGIFKLVLVGTYDIIDANLITTTVVTVGLVAHKAEKEGNFYRVGRFDLSSANEGAHKVFATAKTETVTII
ncbi:heterokaryon incompatibility protein-domain-containing protein [Xylaria arbuscula]|nr:heterokaryon incompatibility protein-domain-containing protein [Xylaria arbuscula]